MKTVKFLLPMLGILLFSFNSFAFDTISSDSEPIAVLDTEPCDADFDNSGAVDAADMLTMLAAFGCISCPEQDLLGCGIVKVATFLEFLTVFGEECDE